jgi:hypothetical protein
MDEIINSDNGQHNDSKNILYRVTSLTKNYWKKKSIKIRHLIINRNNGESMLSRLNEESLAEWLESYTLDELYIDNFSEKNNIQRLSI